jgi:hypothetical protein
MDFRDCLILVQFQKWSILPLARAMSPVYHIGQAGKPVPLAALCHWLHIVAHGHMVNGCRVLAARDPLAAVRHADRGHRVGPTATGPR